MKILLSAIACQPEAGSECKFGWDSVTAIAEFAECHVVTHEISSVAIEEFLEREPSGALTFHYVGRSFRWHPSRLLARLQSWLVFASWQRAMLASAKTLQDALRFDLAHHVTYATWRIPSPLWRLPMPFVWGPIGGGTNLPRSFYPILSEQARNFERLRRISAFAAACRGEFRSCVSEASALVAADNGTALFVEQYRRRGDVHVLSPAFFSQSQMDWLAALDKLPPNSSLPLRVFGGGNLEGRKGVAMALHAISKLKTKGIRATYTLGGSGPEHAYLEQLAAQLGIRDQILISQGFSGDEYRQRLAETDVYLLPSLRETAGITMMEAMLAGCYPIVLSGTGAGDIVERTGGSAISALDPNDAIAKIAQQLEWCHQHRMEMLKHARDGAKMIRALYSKQSYQKAIRAIYAEAVDQHVGEHKNTRRQHS